MSRRGRFLLAGGLAALVAIVLLSLRPNPELEALKADPLARWQPTPATGAAREPLVREVEEGTPSIEFFGLLPGLGDRQGAMFTRTFSVPRAAGLEPFEAARRAAEDAGWRLDYPDYLTADSHPTKTWTTVMGDKELPTGTAVVHIQTDAARPAPGAPARPNTLVVVLEHTR
jgi:hypothetical protein